MYIPAHIVTPRERIALGSRRVTALRGLSQGLAAGLLALQQQILCEAESWMGTVEVPMGSNKGGRVDELLKLYFGSTTAQKWCVVYVWVVYDRAVRALGGVNKLPGASVVWGNAKATLDKSKSIFTVNTTPDVAALFYRTTTKPGDTASSGHFGIVISWDGTTLVTIEGNQGDTSKVDHYTYSAAQIQSYGFQFIHAQRAPVTATSPVAPCKPVATPPTSGGIVPPPSGGATPGGTTPGGTVPVTSGGSSITTGTITTGTTAVTRRPIPCPPCVVKTITLPASGMMRHYSAVLENAVAADIHGASLGVSPSQRNGAATTPSGSPDADAYSGVGVFKDGNGNLIWISNEGFGQYAALRKYGLLGKSDRIGVPAELYEFRFPDFQGDTGKEGNALALQGKVLSPYCAAQQAGQKSEIDFKDIKGTGSSKKMQATIGGRTLEFCNPYQLLQEIEKIGKRLDRPILIVNYHTQPVTWGTVLNTALKILDIAVKYGSMFGLEIPPILPKIQAAVQQLVSSGGALTVSSVAQLATIAWQIAPDSIRQELNTAAAAVEAKAKGVLGDVASILKMGQKNAVQLIAPLVDFASQGAALATAIEGVILNSGLGPTSARSTIQNILNVRMISRFQSQISSGQMVQNFIGSGSNMYEVPEINAMFLTGAAGQLLPLIPQAGEILGPIIQAGETTLEYGTPEKYNNLVRGLALSAIGRPPGTPEFTQELFSDMAFNALNKAAADYAAAGLTSYTLPASVPDCKRECWAIEIAKNNRITVLQNFQPTPGNVFGGSTVISLPKLPTVSVGIVGTPIVSTPIGPSTPIQIGIPTVNNPSILTPNVLTPSILTPNSGGATKIDTTKVLIPNSGPSIDTPTRIDVGTPTSHEYKPPDTITPDIPVSVTNCPPGTHWDNTIHSCVPDYVPPPYVPPKVTECPYGTHWDDVIHSCVPDYTPPPTTYVPPAPYVPPPSIPVTQCPPGMHWDDTVHSCVPDYVPPPVTMVPPPSPDVPNIPATITQCPPGTHWDNTVRSCVPDRPYPVPSPGPSPGPLRPGSPGDGQDCGCGKQEDDDDCDEGLGSLVRETSRREWY